MMMAYYRVSLAVAATAMLSGAAAELPTFEIMDFPLTQHQAAVLNSSIVQEQAPAPALTLGGCRRPRFRSRSCPPEAARNRSHSDKASA